MEERKFQELMLRADTLRGVSQAPEDTEFWGGYVRGLRRFYHAEAFGTDGEHKAWHGIPADEPDLVRRARGEGYRAGLSGVDPVDLFRLINDEYLTTPQLAEAAGVVASRIRQVADKIPGGRRNETGWRFPPSAVDFVKSQPGPGRPKK